MNPPIRIYRRDGYWLCFTTDTTEDDAIRNFARHFGGLRPAEVHHDPDYLRVGPTLNRYAVMPFDTAPGTTQHIGELA